MMYPIDDDLTGRFKHLVDSEGLDEQDRLQVTLDDGRIIRFRVEALFNNEAEYDQFRQRQAYSLETV